MKKNALFGLLATISILLTNSHANANANANAQAIELYSCETRNECIHANIANTLINLANREEIKFVVYDHPNDKAYQYRTINITGNEFGFPIMRAVKVKDLPYSVAQAAKDYIDFALDPVIAGFQLQQGSLGFIDGNFAYELSNFIVDDNVTLGNVGSLLNSIQSQVQQTVATNLLGLSQERLHALLDSVSISMDVKFVSVNWDPKSITQRTVMLKFTEGNTSVAIRFSGIYQNGTFTAEAVAIQLVDNVTGRIFLTIPLIDGQVDRSALIGWSFSHSTPGSLRTMFQSLNLDLRYCTGCHATITHITDEDVGEVDPQ